MARAGLHLPAHSLPLIEGAPPAALEVVLLGGDGEQERVDPGVASTADHVGRGAAVLVGPPRLPPRGQSAFTDGIDDLLGDGDTEFVLARHGVVSWVGDDASAGVSG